MGQFMERMFCLGIFLTSYRFPSSPVRLAAGVQSLYGCGAIMTHLYAAAGQDAGFYRQDFQTVRPKKDGAAYTVFRCKELYQLPVPCHSKGLTFE